MKRESEFDFAYSILEKFECYIYISNLYKYIYNVYGFCRICIRPSTCATLTLMLLSLDALKHSFLVLTTSAGIMDHEEAKRKHTGGKILGFFY